MWKVLFKEWNEFYTSECDLKIIDQSVKHSYSRPKYMYVYQIKI